MGWATWPRGGMPAMEGKCVLSRPSATWTPSAGIQSRRGRDRQHRVPALGSIGGINLGYLAPLLCDREEAEGKSANPIFHAAQPHRIITLAGLVNALKVVGRRRRRPDLLNGRARRPSHHQATASDGFADITQATAGRHLRGRAGDERQQERDAKSQTTRR